MNGTLENGSYVDSGRGRPLIRLIPIWILYALFLISCASKSVEPASSGSVAAKQDGSVVETAEVPSPEMIAAVSQGLLELHESEDCIDGVDNNNDGNTDCEDTLCVKKEKCLSQVPKRLDLFGMSMCQHYNAVLLTVNSVLDQFGRDPNSISFEVSFIGREEDGAFKSVNGPAEVEENLRQLCVQQHYPNNYKFMDYLVCRATAFDPVTGSFTGAWESCCGGPIDKNTIRRCAEGEEGKALLKSSFRSAGDHFAIGSPAVFFNDIFPHRGDRTVESYTESFCTRNRSVHGCESRQGGER
jgi:hypothetical protein